MNEQYYKPSDKITSEIVKKSWYLQRRTFVWAFLVLVVILLAKDVSDIQYQGTKWDTQLTAEYVICQTDLGQYYTNGENALHIADSNSKSLKDLLTAVAAGRYGNATTLNNPNNVVYAQLAAAYPDLHTSSDAYNAARDVLIGSFNNYAEENKKMYTMLSAYDLWRNQNFLNRFIIIAMGFPSSLLVAHDNSSHPATGAEAENMMWAVIADPNVSASYKAGSLVPITFPTP